MNKLRFSIAGVGLALCLVACGSNSSNNDDLTDSKEKGGSAGKNGGGSSGSQNGGGAAGKSSNSSNTSGNNKGGAAGKSDNGDGGESGGSEENGGSTSGGKAGNSKGNAGTTSTTGSAGSAGKSGGTAGKQGGSGGNPGGTVDGGGAGKSDPGSDSGTSPGTDGSTGTGGGDHENALVTSASGAYWKTDGKWTEASSGTATVTIDDSKTLQDWDGMGGAFNERGWMKLTSKEMQDKAMQLLFGADGCNFAWGRIPMGASDYSDTRYTLEDNDDPKPDTGESTRPAKDPDLAKFSLDRDNKNLIPYIKAALGVKSDIRFWASPWTPPLWMKKGYMTASGADRSQTNGAKKPSYYDGGNLSSDADVLQAYAKYYTKFVQGYKDLGINIELVSPQNEPGYDQNYPSCIIDGATYASWIGKYLGPAMKELNVKVMLGTLSNADSNKDISTAQAALNDATAKSFLSVAGVQWGVLDKVNGGQTFGDLPIWATEHMCGNYPWNPSGLPQYNSDHAPNDQAYGEESWGYIKKAITNGKVTAYNAWNMVLDKDGLGNDTTRDWKQDALLVADPSAKTVTETPAYYVFRHISQFVSPGAKVVNASGGDAVAFKNKDGSVVAVMFNSGAANSSYTVAIGSKKLQFAMPSKGWATVVYKG